MRWQSSIVAAIAGGQHGLVTRSQLLAAGFAPAAIERRVRAGALIRVYPGVYRVGHRAPSIEAAYLAAVLACGPGAVLSGVAAAWLLGLVRGRPAAPEVSAAGQRRVGGVRTRRRSIRSIDHRGVPVATVPQTVVDLAAVLDEEDLARAFHEAGVRYGTKPEHVTRAMHGQTKGADRLRQVVWGDSAVILSHLEREFLRLLRDHDLPPPITNKREEEGYVDCHWPKHRVTVELDSYRYHSSRSAWDQDRRRERRAYARGDQHHRRYTYRDVCEHQADMLTELRALVR